MNVAVLGGGFSGLAACYFALKQGWRVSLFEPYGIGAGASGAASGLLHPYPGEKGRLSHYGIEAFAQAKALLQELGSHTHICEGIDRYPISEEQKVHLSENKALSFDGVRFFASEGITVFSTRYLEALYQKCRAMGLVFHGEHFPEADFDSFDASIVAAGYGVRHFSFADRLPIRFIKGQVLVCKRPPWLQRSLVAKGYIATTEDPSTCIVGSTYEHNFADAAPDREEAERQILPRIARFLPFDTSFEVLTCQSGVRVAGTRHYLPLIERVAPKVWALTAMGSRGLLYHAYFGKEVVDRIAQERKTR